MAHETEILGGRGLGPHGSAAPQRGRATESRRKLRVEDSELDALLRS